MINNTKLTLESGENLYFVTEKLLNSINAIAENSVPGIVYNLAEDESGLLFLTFNKIATAGFFIKCNRLEILFLMKKFYKKGFAECMSGCYVGESEDFYECDIFMTPTDEHKQVSKFNY